MKKLLLSLLCLGMLVGCGNSAPTLETDLKDYPDSINTINSIIDEYKQENVILEYKENLKKTTTNKTRFKVGKCELYISTNEDGSLFGVFLGDEGTDKDKYSNDYITVLEATLKLKTFNLNNDTYNQIISFFNDKKEEEKNVDGYKVYQSTKEFGIYQKTDESLSEAIPIKIEEIELKNTKFVKEYDAITFKAKFKNNSNKVIKEIRYEYDCGGQTETIVTENTLKPGDVSTESEIWDIGVKNKKDMKLLKASITYVKDDGENGYIDYDAKLEEYSWY